MLKFQEKFQKVNKYVALATKSPTSKDSQLLVGSFCHFGKACGSKSIPYKRRCYFVFLASNSSFGSSRLISLLCFFSSWKKMLHHQSLCFKTIKFCCSVERKALNLFSHWFIRSNKERKISFTQWGQRKQNNQYLASKSWSAVSNGLTFNCLLCFKGTEINSRMLLLNFSKATLSILSSASRFLTFKKLWHLVNCKQSNHQVSNTV